MTNALVLGGGGVHGFAFIGGLRWLEKDQPIRDQFTHVIGTSIGSLIGLMVVLGYTATEMEEECMRFDFNALSEELKSLDALQLAEKYGLNTGDLLVDQIKQIIRRKTKNGGITLLEMYNNWSGSTHFGAVTVNVNKSESVELNHLTEPSLPVYKAVRMSISVPLLFHPVRYKKHYYIDGGVLSNFPSHFVPKTPTTTITGFRIVSANTGDVSTFQAYITSIVYSVLTEMENTKLVVVSPTNNTTTTKIVNIHVPPNAPSAFQFSISEKNKRRLIKLGYSEAKATLCTDQHPLSETVQD